MKKEEIIRRYGVETWERKQQEKRDWYDRHREEHKARNEKWRVNNPEKMKEWREANSDKVKAHSHEQMHKGGKGYIAQLKYNRSGVQGERHIVRSKHGLFYRPFKQIIAPESQIHHEWIPDTAGYTGVALVEKDQHMHGYIDVIKILEGDITLFTEEQIQQRGGI